MARARASTLVIVESPSKARTLSQLLGSEYAVMASVGHVRDLPKSELGVDVENDFKPLYELIPGKAKTVKELAQAARGAEQVYLATDPDREGESISWHLATALHLVNPERIAFHEVTRAAVQRALAAPRPLDMNLVNAQQARRVLDRLVGYQVSPLLWRKVKTGLSAGRVQSVAVRLVVDRENEIRAFQPVEFWNLDARLATAPEGEAAEFTARLAARASEPGEKLEVHSGEDAERIKAALEGSSYRVASVEQRPTRRQAPPPYITSTLQQDASVRLRFSAKRTMALAQQLYEGVTLGPEGPSGLITYMRTDSTRVSGEAQQAARAHIVATFGAKYAGPARQFKVAASAQDAHEAIRPTMPSRTPDSVRSHLTDDQYRLYNLVWSRFMASQMTAAEFDSTRVDIAATPAGAAGPEYLMRAQGTVLRFEGFQKVWGRDVEREDDRALPPLSQGQDLALRELTAEQRFTQPPPRYTEASLIKELEERGIGRPSTYATIIDTIQDRDYVRQNERRLHPTPLGETVTTLLVDLFPELLDVGFTAQMEEALDDVERGKRQWVPLLREFYGPFSGTLDKAQLDLKRVKVPPQLTDEVCPNCGKPLVIRQGRYGEFTACSGYPDCTYVKRDAVAEPVATGVRCVEPGCGGEIMERRSRKGKTFFGCSNYPKCRAVFWHRPNGEMCPTCGKPTVVRTGRRGDTVFCSDPECPSREGESRRFSPRAGAASGRRRAPARRRTASRGTTAPREPRPRPAAAAS